MMSAARHHNLFWSDLHLGDAFVAATRGYPTAEAHDTAICDTLRRTVRADARITLLGDIVGRASHIEYALALLAALPGEKHLIAGNHDPVASIHRNGWKRQAQFLEVFTSVRDFAVIRLNRQPVLMSHYPYLGESADHTEHARYAQFRLPDMGLPLLHGHTHLGGQRAHGNQLHVGVDAWPDGPVSEVAAMRELGIG